MTENFDSSENRGLSKATPVSKNRPGKSFAARRKRPRKLWPLAVGCLFLVLGAIVASGIGSTGADAESGELQIPTKPDSANGADDAQRFGDRIVSLVSNTKVKNAEHPIDPLLELAEQGFIRIDETIRDYTATVVSQVRLDGTLQPERRMHCKVRHARKSETVDTPFSVYLRMDAPADVKGQEVIWVDGQNNGTLIAHTTGILNIKRFYLDPKGTKAMESSRYPIYEIGFKNLIKKMKEFGLKDREHDECEVTITRDVPIDNRPCTLIEVVHPVKRDHFSHHISKIYLDQSSDVLVGYEGFLWPENEGEKPPLFERYFYLDLQINVGLTAEDFSPDNSEYNFPSW